MLLFHLSALLHLSLQPAPSLHFLPAELSTSPSFSQTSNFITTWPIRSKTARLRIRQPFSHQGRLAVPPAPSVVAQHFFQKLSLGYLHRSSRSLLSELSCAFDFPTCGYHRLSPPSTSVGSFEVTTSQGITNAFLSLDLEPEVRTCVC